MKIILAITGASGVIYGIRLLEEIKNEEVYLIISKNAEKIIEYETNYSLNDLKAFAKEFYREDEIDSKLASGSFIHDAMIICPCSLKTMACIANGIALNLITRAAICCLKEGRKLIVVPRETPLDLMSLENMVRLKRAGAIVLPAMPAFYYKPIKIEDLVNYIVGKILEQLNMNHSLYRRYLDEEI